MAGATRTNQYFIPGDGISREVIQADICRYLGNDALVRPGQYQAMIADLKADSQRWEAERREGEARGFATGTGTTGKNRNGLRFPNHILLLAYRSSTIHQSRQYYGPSEGVPGGQPLAASGQGQGQAQGQTQGQGPVYVNQQPGSTQYEAYSATQYPPSTAAGYTGANYGYAAGGNLAPGSEPRSTYTYPQQPDGSSYDPATRTDPYSGGYGGQSVPGSGQPTPRGGAPSYQPRDPYGRGGYNYPQ
ncbi:hypothetical protein FGG08_001292 [Glutinoglossum americanum]|uniref:Transcription factor RfeG n=1 Tax=Glutinoglossum americanum TaxID=1670608 RepID=A0A9P8IF57_9PEZI|nr:hypothetical protein FGG08_001292 [Glutinoglossum americanum]